MFQVEELEAGTPGRLKVTSKSTETDEVIEGEYNTVCTDPSVPGATAGEHSVHLFSIHPIGLFFIFIFFPGRSIKLMLPV